MVPDTRSAGGAPRARAASTSEHGEWEAGGAAGCEARRGHHDRTRREAMMLDRLHAAMLLQKSGHTNAWRALLTAEQERGPDFLRLANALLALYPRGSEEKWLLGTMLLAVPR